MTILSTDVKSRADQLVTKTEEFSEAKATVLIAKLIAIDGTPFQSGFLALKPDLTLYSKLTEFAQKLLNISEYKPGPGKPNQNALKKHQGRIEFVNNNIAAIEKLCNDFEFSVFRAYRSYLLENFISDVLTLGTKHAEILNLQSSGDVFIKKDTLSTFEGRKSEIDLIVNAYDELRQGKLSIFQTNAGGFFTKGARLESLCLTATEPLKSSIDAHYSKVQAYYTQLAKAKTAKPPPKQSVFLYPGQLVCLLQGNQATIAGGTTFNSNQTNSACGEYSRRYLVTNTDFVIHGHYRASGKKLCNLHIKHLNHEGDLGYSTWIEDSYYQQLIALAPGLKVTVT